MRLFNAKVIDEFLEGDGAVAESNLAWPFLLPQAESLKFTCIVDEVTDATATLTVQLFDGTASSFEVVKTLVAGVAIPKTFSPSYSPQDATYPPGRYLVPLVQLNGSNGPTAHVRLWVCGRGPQRLEDAPVQASFAAQYQAARLIADEDRLASKKRLLKAGASSAYSPALLYPSLKWER